MRYWICLGILLILLTPCAAQTESAVDIRVKPADGKDLFVPGEYLGLIIEVANKLDAPLAGLRVWSNQGCTVVLPQPVPAQGASESKIALPVYDGNLSLTFSEALSRESRFAIVRQLSLKAVPPAEERLRPPLPVGTGAARVAKVRPDVFDFFGPARLSAEARVSLFIALGFLAAAVVIAGIFISHRRPVIAAIAVVALAIAASYIILWSIRKTPQTKITQQAVVWVPAEGTTAVRQTFFAIASRSARAREGRCHVIFTTDADVLPKPLAYQWEDLFDNRWEILWNANPRDSTYTAAGIRQNEVRVFCIEQEVRLASPVALEKAPSLPEDVRTPVSLRDAALFLDSETIPRSRISGDRKAVAWWKKNFHHPGGRYLVGFSDAPVHLKIQSPDAVIETLPTLWVFALPPAAAD